MLRKYGYLFLIVFLILGNGCSREANQAQTQARPKNNAATNSPVNFDASIFQDGSEKKQARASFLSSEKFVCNETGGTLNYFVCDLNTQRAAYQSNSMPRSPMFGYYRSIMPRVLISAKFPNDFAPKLPLSIQKQVLIDSPEELEIFWNVQSLGLAGYLEKTGISDPKVQFKSHFWADPKAEEGDGGDSQFKFAVQLFETLDNVNDQLSTQFSVEVPAHWHGTISPGGVGFVDFSILKTQPMTALWTYAYDFSATTGKCRAAVTLHWIVDPVTIEGLDLHMKSHENDQNVEGFLNDMKTSQSFESVERVDKYSSNGDFDFYFVPILETLDLSRIYSTFEEFATE
jgi:hypothetical protein